MIRLITHPNIYNVFKTLPKLNREFSSVNSNPNGSNNNRTAIGLVTATAASAGFIYNKWNSFSSSAQASIEVAYNRQFLSFSDFNDSFCSFETDFLPDRNDHSDSFNVYNCINNTYEFYL